MNHDIRSDENIYRNSTGKDTHLHVTKQLVVVGGDDHVDRLDGASEGLVHLLRGEVELQQSAVHLSRHKVWRQNRQGNMHEKRRLRYICELIIPFFQCVIYGENR